MEAHAELKLDPPVQSLHSAKDPSLMFTTVMLFPGANVR